MIIWIVNLRNKRIGSYIDLVEEVLLENGQVLALVEFSDGGEFGQFSLARSFVAPHIGEHFVGAEFIRSRRLDLGKKVVNFDIILSHRQLFHRNLLYFLHLFHVFKPRK